MIVVAGKLPVDTVTNFAIISAGPDFTDAQEVHTMRSQILAATCLSWSVAWGVVGLNTRAAAQSPPDPSAFRNGVAYTFEREIATRDVNDAYDHGTISLVANVWRPLSQNHHEIVLFSHGSFGGMADDPREPLEYIPSELLEFLVRRGYTVVVPLRRGVGGSTGTFREECPFAAGKCTLEQYRELAEPGIAEAIKDSNAVIDQVIEGKEVPRGSKIILAGISRGGFLSLRLAAERPELTRGVVNFVGGWLSISNRWPAQENAARVELENRLFRSIGYRARAPSLWIYASRDPFYSEKTTRDFFAEFKTGGGTGRYFYVADHSLRIGHMVAADPKLWDKAVGSFLDNLRDMYRPR
jgi:pimeloyl-ACP methyl ester carboxylesterase